MRSRHRQEGDGASPEGLLDAIALALLGGGPFIQPDIGPAGLKRFDHLLKKCPPGGCSGNEDLTAVCNVLKPNAKLEG